MKVMAGAVRSYLLSIKSPQNPTLIPSLDRNRTRSPTTNSKCKRSLIGYSNES